MKLHLHITLIVLSGVSLAGWLTGCVTPPKETIVKSTTEYNLVAEKAGNEMLLLNIVRASKRRPMYFTSFAKLTGNMTYDFGTVSMNIPFGKIGTGLNGAYTIIPSVGYKSSPLFDLAILDTKEFTCGITTPVPMTTIEYYRSQGWPKEILLHLFIRRIEVRDEKGKLLEEYDNYPEDQKNFDLFQNELRAKAWDITVDPNRDATCIGEVDAKQAEQLKELIEMQKAGLKLRPGKTDSTKSLCLRQDKYVFARDEGGALKATFASDSGQQRRVYIRSPEAILYYLGEIMRAENRAEKPYTPMVNVGHDPCAPPSPAVLFRAREAKIENVAPRVSVNYEGTKYVLPGDPNSNDGYYDRSMHVLSLVSQLIGLQKTSPELPVTSVVSVIGQ